MKLKIITLSLVCLTLLFQMEKSEAAHSQRECYASNYGYGLAIRIDGNLHREYGSVDSLIAALNQLRESGDCVVLPLACSLGGHGWYPAIRIGRSGSIFRSYSASGAIGVQAAAADITKLAAAGACTVRSRPCSLGTYGTATPSLYSEGAGHLFLMRTEDEVRQSIAMLRELGLCAAD